MMLNRPDGKRRTVRTQQELNALLLSHERYVASQGGLRAQLGHAVLDGLNLANRKLSEADLSAASLVGATLCGSSLSRASLYCADLRGADLQHADLTRTDMRGASLVGATLAHAVLDGADLRAATMMMYGQDENVSVLDRNAGAGARKAAAGSHGVDFSNCSLKHVSFSNALLEGTNFDGALLNGARFKGAKLTNPCFRNAVLTGVNLSEFDLPAQCFEGCVRDVTAEALARAAGLKLALNAHQDWLQSDGRHGAPAMVTGEDLRPLESDLAGRTLAGVQILRTCAIGVDFSHCKLQGARFDGCDLRDADFSSADLRGASFRDAKLTHARFAGANLGGLAMAGGRVLKPDLAGAKAGVAQFVAASLEHPLVSLGLCE